MLNYTKFVVYCRYEYHSKNGIEFCKWYRYSDLYNTENEAIEYMKLCKEKNKAIDKKMKLKHEFEVRQIDETLLSQIKMKVGKGRYKKVKDEVLDDIAKRLIKKNEVLIDSSIGAYIYNTDAYHSYLQKKIDKKYNGEKWVHFWYDDDDNCYALLKEKDAKIIF